MSACVPLLPPVAEMMKVMTVSCTAYHHTHTSKRRAGITHHMTYSHLYHTHIHYFDSFAFLFTTTLVKHHHSGTHLTRRPQKGACFYVWRYNKHTCRKLMYSVCVPCTMVTYNLYIMALSFSLSQDGIKYLNSC